MRREVLKARSRHPGAAVMLIGTDLPDLECRDLIRAIEPLQNAPLVLGPARDGGYWLLGLAAADRGAARAQPVPAATQCYRE